MTSPPPSRTKHRHSAWTHAMESSMRLLQLLLTLLSRGFFWLRLVTTRPWLSKLSLSERTSSSHSIDRCLHTKRNASSSYSNERKQQENPIRTNQPPKCASRGPRQQLPHFLFRHGKLSTSTLISVLTVKAIILTGRITISQNWLVYVYQR